MEEGWEGCLSVPGMRGVVPRWRRLRYKGFDEPARAFTREVEGFHARVVQHECDHLDRRPLSDADPRLHPLRLHRRALPRPGPAGRGLGEDDIFGARREGPSRRDFRRAAQGHDQGESAEALQGARRGAVRAAGLDVGRQGEQRHGGAAGARHRRQGRRHQARRRLPQPARRERRLLRRADARGARSTTSSGACTATRRGWASSRSSTARTTRTCWWCACTTSCRRSSGRSATATSPTSRSCWPSTAPSSSSTSCTSRKKEQKQRLLEREKSPADGLEAQPQRLEGTRLLGRVHRGLRGRDLEDRRAARALDRRAGEREVVSQPGGRRVDRRGAARATARSWEKTLERDGRERAARGSPPTARRRAAKKRR